MPLIAFISGHRDITHEEFSNYYVPLLDAALQRGDHFVVGDYHGADTMAQKYLSTKTNLVTVYHMFTTPRNHLCGNLCGGFTSDDARDSAMTQSSDYDIAWVRLGRTKSGTARNLKRRATRTPPPALT